MTTLLLIRHGQSLANKYKFCSGQSHFPLSYDGKHQADCVGEYILQNYTIQRLYSSDLLRAFETACAISACHGMMEITTVPQLREINVGDWESKHIAEINLIDSEGRRVWDEDIYNCTCGNGGETVCEMAQRALNTILALAHENDGKTIAVVCHATIIRAIHCYSCEGSFEPMKDYDWPKNVSVTVLSCEDDKLHFVKQENVLDKE